MDFPKLNLPPVALRTRMGDRGRAMVWDVLRRRYVTLTAEEWVRQHFVHYLLEACGYPAGLLANEIAVEVGRGSGRGAQAVRYGAFCKRGGASSPHRGVQGAAGAHYAGSVQSDTELQQRFESRLSDREQWFAALLLSDGLCCAAGYLLTRYPPF